MAAIISVTRAESKEVSFTTGDGTNVTLTHSDVVKPLKAMNVASTRKAIIEAQDRSKD